MEEFRSVRALEMRMIWTPVSLGQERSSSAADKFRWWRGSTKLWRWSSGQPIPHVYGWGRVLYVTAKYDKSEWEIEI